MEQRWEDGRSEVRYLKGERIKLIGPDGIEFAQRIHGTDGGDITVGPVNRKLSSMVGLREMGLGQSVVHTRARLRTGDLVTVSDNKREPLKFKVDIISGDFIMLSPVGRRMGVFDKIKFGWELAKK